MSDKFLLLFLSLSLYFCPSHEFVGNNIFSSRDERLLEVFCVENVDQLVDIGKRTWTHETITNEGLKKSIITFLKEISVDQSFEVPADASLSEVFQAYYGECASPDRFLSAVQSVIDANIDLDSQPVLKEDPDLHFDAEHVPEGQKRLFERNNQINTVTTVDQNYAAARTLLGQSLHAVQKFYSHTSWIENGNSGIADLLTPGLTVPPSTTPTCNNDCTDDCSNNIITDQLTSGYFPFHEPPEGKCFHGGSLDDEYSGINKDTTSACYSPHYLLHETATSLAIKATENYVDQVRANIGNRDFGALFDLGNSSALAILLDTSGSMGNEIEAVKVQIIEIIEEAGRGGIIPSEYFLAAFEEEIKFTRTKDPEVLRAALEELSAGGGYENLYTAAQMVLSQAPPYTDIIAFTDEPNPEDQALLMNSVINLARDKQSKINIIWTDSLPKSNKLRNSRSIEALQETCQQTGGLFMESSKVDVYDIVALLTQSIESTKATITSISSAAGVRLVTFPVDSSLSYPEFRIGLTINGRLTRALLTSPDGIIEVDLLDPSSIEQSPLEIKVVYSGDSLLTISFKPNQVGMWNVTSTSSTAQDIQITASCTHNFIPNFQVLDLNSTHPNLRTLRGKPISNSSPLLSIQLTASSRTKISSIDSVSFISAEGQILHTYRREDTSYATEIIFNLAEFRIPSDSFYIRLEGKDTAGNLFWRLALPRIDPASTSVEITASSSRIEAPPGESAQAEYIVTNFGSTSQVQIEITDDKVYLSSFTPKTLTLNPNQSGSVFADFNVPPSALVGTVSGIVVTATSSLDGTQNYARSTLVVISDIDDSIKPNITVTSTTNCPPVSQATCSLSSWQFMTQIYDSESGLNQIKIETTGSGTGSNTTIPPFTPGTTDVVSSVFNANCCVRGATISAYDVTGNANSKYFDQGPIRDCGRIIVCPTCITSTSILTEWNRPCAFDKWQRVDHYEFTFVAQDGEVDEIKTSYCDTADCIEPIVNLRSCVRYNMTLTAFQAANAQSGETETYRTEIFTTLPEAPSPPTVISTVNKTDSSILLTWFPPTKSKECVHHYKVCFREMPDAREIERSVEECRETSEITNYNAKVQYRVEGLQPCQRHRFIISAVGKDSSFVSREATYEDETGFRGPSQPVNFRVVSVKPNDVTLCWNKPVQNPKCIRSYQTTFLRCSQDKRESFLELMLNNNNLKKDSTLPPTTAAPTTAAPTTAAPTTAAPTTAAPTTAAPTTAGPTAAPTTAAPTAAPTTAAPTTAAPTAAPTTAAPTTAAPTTAAPTTAAPTTAGPTATPTTTFQPSTTTNPLDGCDFHETVGGLQACSCYNFSLTAVAADGTVLTGDTTAYTSTIFTDQGILPPNSVRVEDIREESVYVGWFPPEQDFNCIGGFEVEWVNNVYPKEDNGSHVVEADTFSDIIDTLSPCSSYNVTVSTIAQHLHSTSQPVNFITKDIAPGEATDLVITQLFSDGFEVEWCDPINEPQCAKNWDRDITDNIGGGEIPECNVASMASRSNVVRTCRKLESHDLDCGATYLFKLWASSPTGITGPVYSCKVQTKSC